jgi:hypothetical protein
MSYDIAFRAKVEGFDYWTSVAPCESNTTWNVREMIVKSTGLEWKNEQNNGLCKDIIPFIRKGYSELTEHPEKYREYEATNGWGTVESTAKFFKKIIDDWEDATRFNKQIEQFATFWID